MKSKEKTQIEMLLNTCESKIEIHVKFSIDYEDGLFEEIEHTAELCKVVIDNKINAQALLPIVRVPIMLKLSESWSKCVDILRSAYKNK